MTDIHVNVFGAAPILPSVNSLVDGGTVTVRTLNSPLLVQVGITGGGAGITDHGALTGLEDDDHPQYILGDRASWTDLTDGGATTLHTHTGGGTTDHEDLGGLLGGFTNEHYHLSSTDYNLLTGTAFLPSSDVDTDTAMTADSDLRVPSQAAVVAYVAANAGGHAAVTVADTTTIDLTLSGQALSADLKNTTVTPGSYINADITVDAQGRITAASSGAAAGKYEQFLYALDGLGGFNFLVDASGNPLTGLFDLR